MIRVGLGIWGDFLKKVMTHEKEKPGAGGHLKKQRAENVRAAVPGVTNTPEKTPTFQKGGWVYVEEEGLRGPGF